jgi:hypothetical protein
MHLVLGFVVALLIGVTLGLLGGGGSIMTVPTLLYLFHLETRVAIATSLVVVGVTSVAALVSHALAGQVRWREGVLFGVNSMAAAYIAARVAKYIASSLLLAMFGAVMWVTAWAMLRGRGDSGDESGQGTSRAKVIAQGLAVGVLTGLVGAGGGFLVVPALVLLGGMPMRAAVGTSLLVIAMNAAAGLAGQLPYVSVPWQTAAVVSAVAVLGSFAGGRLAEVVSPDRLRRGFAYFIIAMGVFVFFKP